MSDLGGENQSRWRPVLMDRFIQAKDHQPYFVGMVAGVLLVLWTFLLLSVVIDIYSAFNIIVATALTAIYLAIVVFLSGFPISKIAPLRDRLTVMHATLHVSGVDDEQVDRTAITVRSLAEKHRLKVEGDTILTDVPEELKFLKHRQVTVYGSLHKMRGFQKDADEYLSTQGMEIRGDD